MHKKIISLFAILTILSFLPISTQADFPTGDLGYSDEIAVGKEFEWTVSKLVLNGDFSDYSSKCRVNMQQ